MTEDFYRAAVLNQRAVDNFIKSLNLKSCMPEDHAHDIFSCDECVHMCAYGCSFDFPDAGGAFANECSMFEPDKR